ncbi:adenylate/guanylate cyclase domain-containing protein [Sulfurimonas sp.]|uniref:CHASE2 domain-containing protein n=1 Tax=Sulfurimonas sp. TaxID=2022749 RepID=UPI002634F945|nr:adenylate/guanylate cyclase domain-containing protein [Sulfurimonas sp.]MCW8894737.1 adenylate/guanylate cyclase domain-containing protein [Sulfurimonas sp.]MCW9067550.1 adenylate/guanylate cyclase domain-containing protein [Sulfurimonas sp.]
MKNKYKVLTLLFILILLTISSAYLYLPNHFQSLDNRVRDFYFKYRGPEKASDDIIIVDIDEKSIKELGQWPWERDKFAQILTNLTNSGVGIIGLDIVFAEADKTSPSKFAKDWGITSTHMPDYDMILSQAIADTPTILGYIFDFDTNEYKNDAPQIPAIFIEKNKSTSEFFPHAKGVLTNLPVIQNEGYSSGFMNNIPDATGIIRSVPLMIKYNEIIYPSLAFEMYRIASNSKKVTVSYSDAGIENIQLGKQNIASDRFGRLHLNFRGPSKSYKYISAVDVLNNKMSKEEIEGKFILIGTSAYGLMDLRSTPMDDVIAGVEIQANLIDNLLNNDMLIRPSWSELADLSMIVILLFIVLFLYSRLSFFKLFIVFTASFISLLLFNYYLLFSQHLILNSIFPIITMIVSLITVLGVNYMFEFRQKEMVKNSFSKKVSKQVMEDLLLHLDDTDLTSKEVQATVYFSDIRGFTSISEDLKSPKRITDFLNFYMNAMVAIVEENQGTIDKFIGDAIMAYWNAPLKIENHADKAVHTALKQIEQRDILNKTINKDFGFDVDYGIGINTGDVVVGEIGSHGRSDYTIIGDSVNLASRLEGLCKEYKVRLVISEFTKEKLTLPYVVQLLDIVRVKGKNKPIKIYEVLSIGMPTQEKQLELQKYNEAYDLYTNAKFREAYETFKKLYEVYKKPLYEMYAKRCENLLDIGLKNFDGVFEFTTK